MKKDYSPVTNVEADLCQKSYARKFWASRWDASGISTEGLRRNAKYLIIQRYLKNLPRAGTRILDGGCGLGQWSILLAQDGFRGIGMDLCWPTLGRVISSVSSSARFIAGDLGHLPFKKGSFHAYFSWGAFEHDEAGLGASINEGLRVLDPGGLLFITVPYQNWRHILRDSRPLPKWDENYVSGIGYSSIMRFYQWRFRPEELRRELEMRGFTVLEIVPIDKAEGVMRMMHCEFGWLKPGTFIYNLLKRLLLWFLPASFVSHMLMIVGKRRI